MRQLLLIFPLDVDEGDSNRRSYVGLGLNLGLPDCSLPSETGQVTLGSWILGRGVDIVEELIVVYELIFSEYN